MAIVNIQCGKKKVTVRVVVDSSVQMDTRDVIDLCNQFAEKLDERVEERANMKRQIAASAAPGKIS